MKTFLFAIVCALFSFGLTAQNFWQDYPYLNIGNHGEHADRNFIVAEGTLAYGCDGVNNEFLNHLYKGGYIDSAFIEKSAGELLPTNRFGVSTTAGLTYGHYLNDTTREMFSVSLLQRSNISGRFSDDAFRLGFQGNTRYKGEEADFGRTRFNSMSWTQLKFGYVTPGENSIVSFSFSLLAGHNYNQADVAYGKLFTDSQGLFLNASVAGDYWSSDTSNTSAFALNGMGTSVDITWLYYQPIRGTDVRVFKLDMLDFGFINWNNKTIHRYADTTFSWHGVDISQLFINPDFVNELPEENDFIKSDTTEFHRSIFLPATARGTYSQTFFSGRLIGRAAVSVPFWSEALPYGALTASVKFPKAGTTITSGVAYGGYARLQVPLKIEFFRIAHAAMEIGTHNVLAFIDPAKVAGSGAFVKLSYCF